MVEREVAVWSSLPPHPHLPTLKEVWRGADGGMVYVMGGWTCWLDCSTRSCTPSQSQIPLQSWASGALLLLHPAHPRSQGCTAMPAPPHGLYTVIRHACLTVSMPYSTFCGRLRPALHMMTLTLLTLLTSASLSSRTQVPC